MRPKVSIVPGAELGRAEVERWAQLQESDPSLASPFFRPEYTQAVAAVRADVFVAILEQAGQVAGFFPFQRSGPRVGVPVGGERSNYQGMVAAPGLECDARELVRACGLAIWEFHHLLPGQAAFAPFHERLDDSPYMDLADGFEGYATARGGAGSRVIKRLRQQVRRIEREVGALRFEPHDPDPDALRAMMGWKSEQYRATGSQDRFALAWNVELMERLHAWRAETFAGTLPTLYADEKLIAAAMCLRSRGVLHYWFPAYDQELASYSPGMLLLLRLAEDAAGLAIHTIDLGRGRTPYKDRLANAAFQVAEGAVTVPSLAAGARAARRGLRRAIRSSPLRVPVRSVARSLSRMRSG